MYKLTDLLKEDYYSQNPDVRNRELDAEHKETIFVLLDTYQSGIYIFTGVSKSRKGIEELKKKVIKRFKMKTQEELDHLQIFEVPLDEYFDMRAKLDVDVRSADYEG